MFLCGCDGQADKVTALHFPSSDMATYPSLWQLLQALRRLSCKQDPLNCSSSVATAVNLAAFCLVLPLLGGSSTIHGQSSQSQWFSFPAFPQTWQLLATSCPWGRASGCWQWIRKASVSLWVSLDFRKPPHALQEGSSWQCSRSRHCFLSPRDSPLTRHRPGQHQRLGNRLQLISNSTHGPALTWAASEILFPSYKYLDAPMCLGWSALVHGQSHGLPTKASFHGVDRWGVLSPLNLRQ